MKHLLAPALFTLLVLACSLVSADAQMGFSPSAPPVTSSGINRSGSAAAPLPPQHAGQPAAGTANGAMVNGYGMVVPTQPQLSTEAIDPDHKLERGDQLSYSVLEDRDDKVSDLVVTATGEVQLPLNIRVKAVGKSTRELAADIKSQLERTYYYHATVNLGFISVAQRTSRGTVYVTGAVKSSGPVELPLDSALTASQAIYRMGGPVDFSALAKTRVMRKGGPEKGIPVNVKAVQSGKLEQDVVLEPGDTVIVPEATFGIKF